jgi:hypothetical protein
MTAARTILWRRLDRVGLESARLERHAGFWRFAGTVIVKDDERPCTLVYEVQCDGEWVTRAARVSGSMGIDPVDIHLVASGGRWLLNGAEQPQVEGCIDVDMGFTPSTNTLPIRRLSLREGESSGVTAAWLRFPELEVRRLDQVYARTGETTYRYASGGGSFTAELEVDDVGLVRQYGEYWAAE